jgi:hypothetical protein
MTKTCFKCHQTRLLDEFYKHPGMRDGHLNKCKTCARWDSLPRNGVATGTCSQCGRTYRTTSSELTRRGKSATLCSVRCRTTWLTAHAPHGPEKTNWKGDAADYSSVHKWVTRHLGRPDGCEHCGDTSRRHYEWSNISQQYRREPTDWQRLCKPCHIRYDQLYRCVMRGSNIKQRFGAKEVI